MAKARRRTAKRRATKRRATKRRAKAPAGKATPIVFTLSATQRSTLKKRGVLRNGATAVLRVRLVNGRLIVLRHKKGNQFVPSNSAFA